MWELSAHHLVFTRPEKRINMYTNDTMINRFYHHPWSSCMIHGTKVKRFLVCVELIMMCRVDYEHFD